MEIFIIKKDTSDNNIDDDVIDNGTMTDNGDLENGAYSAV